MAPFTPEGNALFVSEVLKDLQERHLLLQDEEGTWTLLPEVQGPSDLPASITAVLEQRLARLERQLHDMLTCASVEGEEFTAQVISAVRKLDEDHVIDTLIDILSHQYEIVSAKEERRIAQRRLISLFAFRHSLMQAHLYNTLEPLQKRRLHQRIGECLEELYGETAGEIAPALARHFAEARDLEKALRYALLAAGRAETAYDFRTAREWLRRAIDHLSYLSPTPQAQAEVWHRLGRAEVFTGSFAEAERYYHKALELLTPNGEGEKRADLLADLGYCYIQTDRSQTAASLLTEALTLNHQLGRSAQVAYNMVHLAFAHHKGERQDLAKDLLLRAGKQFEDLDDRAGMAAVNRHLGINYRIEGNFELSVRHLEEAARLDREAANKYEEASDYTNLGSTYLMLRDDEVQAMAYYQKSLELSSRISKIHEEGHVLLNIARLYALQRDWPRALQCVEEGLRSSEIVQENSNIIRGYWYRGIIRFYIGQLREAITDYERALALGVHDARARWGVLYNLGSLQREAGAIQAALKTYHEASEFLLGIAEGMPPEQRAGFVKAQHKVHVFRALRATAEQASQLEVANSLLARFPVETSLETSQPLPRFYWGAGKWI